MQNAAELCVAAHDCHFVFRGKIVAEEGAAGGSAFCATDAGRRTDGENKRDDRHRQQDGEDNAEVVLKVLLNPGNHGETVDGRRRQEAVNGGV